MPKGELWSDEKITVREVDGDLIAVQEGTSYVVYDGDIEDEESPVPQNLISGETYGNSRWLVFFSVDSGYLGSPWRLHVADRQDLTQPPRTVGQYTGGSESPGFSYPDLYDDKLVWTEPIPGDTFRIRYLDLTNGEPTTLAEGKVQAARFIDDTHIVWQTLAENDTLTVDQYDLTTGSTTRVSNPISELGPYTGHLAVKDDFWVLADVPSGDPDDESTTYDLWVWWPGQEKAIRIAAFTVPAYLSTSHALDNGILGVTTQDKGSYVVNLNTGIAQRVHDGWVLLEPGDGVIHAGLDGPTKDSALRTTIPLSEVAQAGECIATELTD